MINRDPPTTCDPQIVAAIEKSSADAGLKCQEMISRAYHDSLVHGADLPDRHDFYSLPQRLQPSARRVFFAGSDRQRGGCIGPHFGATFDQMM